MTSNNSNYKVLARKYRPQDFSSLIGQDHVVKTLSNEFASRKIPHAFVFTGIRGTGKTSTARIMAKALNCLGENNDNTEETVTPCLKCSACIDIAKGIHPDVIEMDAASKTGVDDVREIIENCTYTPSSARYKIYIIDEVHMLSNSAFNALLKTLEEPPSHTKFIFATTEIEKIPLTILSRCQRFDLNKIKSSELSDLLVEICAAENIKTDHESIELIAELADGSVRDSLSMLDQVQFLCEQNLQIEQVRSMLGISSKSNNFILFEKLVNGDVEKTIEHLKQLFDKNISAQKILSNLLDTCHILATSKIGSGKQKNLDNETLSLIDSILGKIDVSALSRIWQMLLKGVAELKVAPDQNKALEMLVIRICFLEKNFDFKAIISQNGNSENSDQVKKKVI
ncbi:MAG: DNA polymerase III subunit gamma/tau [Rickettsiales bacterium]|nr:DNA polymerase III subunit gamma/tau [Rickettsiales bacterium]